MKQPMSKSKSKKKKKPAQTPFERRAVPRGTHQSAICWMVCYTWTHKGFILDTSETSRGKERSTRPRQRYPKSYFWTVVLSASSRLCETVTKSTLGNLSRLSVNRRNSPTWNTRRTLTKAAFRGPQPCVYSSISMILLVAVVRCSTGGHTW